MQRAVRSTVHVIHQTTLCQGEQFWNTGRGAVLKPTPCVRGACQPRIQDPRVVRSRYGFLVSGAEMWPQHGRSDRHMVDLFTRKLNRRQGRRFCSIVSPITTVSHVVDASASVLSPPTPPSWLVSGGECRHCVQDPLFEYPS